MIAQRARPLLALIALLCVSFNNTRAQKSNDNLSIDVTVTNEKGRIVLGLKPENFTVTSNNLPLKITSLSFEHVPANVGILVDVSASAGPDSKKLSAEFRKRLVAGINRFVELSNPQNDYSLTVFDASVASSISWTGNTPVDEKMVGPGSKRDGTVLYDAIHSGIEQVTAGRHSRKVLVVITDGQDNASKKMFRDVRESIKRSPVTVYAIAVLTADAEGSALGMEGQGILDELTAVSGGRMVPIPDYTKVEAVTRTFENIANELLNQYRLSVEPATTSKPKWHKLKLKVKFVDEAGRKPEVLVRARQEFYY